MRRTFLGLCRGAPGGSGRGFVPHPHHFPPSDSFAVANTLNEFLMCFDRGDPATFASLFKEGGGGCEVLKLGTVAKSREELEALCLAVHNRFKGAIHLEHNHVIEARGEGRCVNRSYWQALKGGETLSYGIHVDEMVFSPQHGAWLFDRRRIYHLWTKDGGGEQWEGWKGIETP
eukprot:Hpha_TRINITY_DN34862_c0_g1::TRINITY_DN34862_c0_g1_i1::g.167863::m.167863